MSNNIISGCVYCGGTSYGKGCLFGPLNIHVITSEPNLCIYCGSPSLGSGCVFNPYGKNHVRAATFFNRNITEKLILLKYFLEKKLDSKSNLDKFYIKLSEKINMCVDPLIHTFLIQESFNKKNTDNDNLIKKLELCKEFEKLFEKMDFLLQSYKNVITTEEMENVLLQSLISKNDENK